VVAVGGGLFVECVTLSINERLTDFLMYQLPRIGGLYAVRVRQSWQATITREAEPANVEPITPRQHRRPDRRALEVHHVRHLVARGKGTHLVWV
jgi:hypothetical protein